MCSTGDESGDDQSTKTQDDVDSEVTFEDDLDEDMDATTIEEEEWIDCIKRITVDAWKRWNMQRFDAGTGPTKK